ncbi:MAG: chemotaxis protein CheB [Deltaproteobacteria bacterium]|nr:chemotaxis protein CheB [Candidatus Desulfobacula maris]MBL6993098.1 chemotaxis protein CheB [Desulfobacula sp.]
MKKNGYKAIVMGVSAGGLAALSRLFSDLPEGFALPLIVVQHVHPTADRQIFDYFNSNCPLTVKEVEDKEKILAGYVYFAPPDYHLLVERDKTFSLSIDPRVTYSRPAIDVLFESAAYVWSSRLIGILLTGASSDGSRGMQLIKAHGGLTIAQDPATAEYPVMPQSAIDANAADKILSLDGIGKFLKTLSKTGYPDRQTKIQGQADFISDVET